jgi:hypothetical protein
MINKYIIIILILIKDYLVLIIKRGHKKKNIFQRIYIGIKKGILTPTLPDKILKLHNHPFIKIFRVIGGISVLLILTHSLEYLDKGLLYLISLWICLIFSITFSFYHIYISYFRINHIIFLLKSDKLDIYNSPFDRFATIITKIFLCSKGICEGIAPIGIVFGGLTGIDELRKAKGLEPIFLPKIADFMFSETDVNKQLKEMKSEESSFIKLSKEMGSFNEENQIVDSFEKNGVINSEEANILREQIKNNESLTTIKRDEVKSKILNSIAKLNEIRNNRN